MVLKTSDHSNTALGIFLILLGGLFLLIQLNYFDWGNFWPLIIVCIGLAFMVGFFMDQRNYGLLMPASVLLIIGLLFTYLTLTGWGSMEDLWPTFILAPGIGFLLMALYAPKPNKLWFPGSILIVVATVFYARFWDYLRYWPVILIILGLYLIFDRKSMQPPADH